MIVHALKYIVETAQQAVAPKLILADDREAHYDVRGEITTISKPPSPANHHVYSLVDLVDAVLSLHASFSESGDFTVWHARDQVIGVFDQTDRRDVVRFRLTFAESFAAIMELENGGAYTQKAFVDFLDIMLGVDKAIIAPFRKLDWQRQIAASGEVAHGQDRMGREIQAQVAGTSELPEDLMVNTAVYREKGERDQTQVRCFIRLDPANERIMLRPVPGEIDRAVEWAQASIRQRLAENLSDGAAIFYGSP